MAKELVGWNITSNCICPGIAATDIRAGISEADEKAQWDAVPMKRPGTPQEMADLMCFLVSEAASYITGEAVNINGGAYMN
jgi:3-oxoacyl-[acyl-carrier protein] reductase